MDDPTALKMLAAYFEGQLSPAEYQQVLDYLATTPQAQSGLAALYRDVTKPGGIDSATCQAWMPEYLDEVIRSSWSEAQCRQFLLHLAHCTECAQDYFDLAGFGANLDTSLPVPAFKVPAGALPTAASWPDELATQVQTLLDLPDELKLAIRFAPKKQAVVSGYNTGYAKRRILFSAFIAAKLAVNVEVAAVRAGNAAFDLVVSLTGANFAAGDLRGTAELSYASTLVSQVAGSTGEIVFKAVPLAGLAGFELILNLRSVN